MFTSVGMYSLCLIVLWLSFGQVILCQHLDNNGSIAGVSQIYPNLLATRAALPEGTCTKDIECETYACCNGEIVSFGLLVH